MSLPGEEKIKKLHAQFREYIDTLKEIDPLFEVISKNYELDTPEKIIETLSDIAGWLPYANALYATALAYYKKKKSEAYFAARSTYDKVTDAQKHAEAQTIDEELMVNLYEAVAKGLSHILSGAQSALKLFISETTIPDVTEAPPGIKRDVEEPKDDFDPF